MSLTLSAGGPEKFSVLAKRGDLHFLNFQGGLSENERVDFVMGGPEDLLKVIFNC